MTNNKTEANNKPTLVLGASENPARYSYRAVNQLEYYQYEVYAVGRRPGMIGNVTIHTGMPLIEGIHTITIYMNNENQKPFYEYIFRLNPKRIIFNPGAENDELFRLAKSRGIECVEACTLVMLSIGNF